MVLNMMGHSMAILEAIYMIHVFLFFSGLLSSSMNFINMPSMLFQIYTCMVLWNLIHVPFENRFKSHFFLNIFRLLNDGYHLSYPHNLLSKKLRTSQRFLMVTKTSQKKKSKRNVWVKNE